MVAAAGVPLLSPAIIHFRPPLLILQGTADDEVGPARQFESGVRAGGWRVDSHYYAGGDHYLFYNDPTHVDAVAHIASFFKG
ncbi:MAG: alpha/beta hydrolase [Dehalococcoidia bacterium]|nr:alpha/beta hydrolase [Dehalococcoidia bacterium]